MSESGTTTSKGNQTKFEKSKELLEVEAIIQKVESHKKWEASENVPLTLRLKSLIQSILDLEHESKRALVDLRKEKVSYLRPHSGSISLQTLL